MGTLTHTALPCGRRPIGVGAASRKQTESNSDPPPHRAVPPRHAAVSRLAAAVAHDTVPRHAAAVTRHTFRAPVMPAL